MHHWFCVLLFTDESVYPSCRGCPGYAEMLFSKCGAYAPAREISVYDFSNVVFSAIWGMLFLEQEPDLLSVLGYVIIIGTAVIKWYYTRKRWHMENPYA